MPKSQKYIQIHKNNKKRRKDRYPPFACGTCSTEIIVKRRPIPTY